MRKKTQFAGVGYRSRGLEWPRNQVNRSHGGIAQTFLSICCIVVMASDKLIGSSCQVGKGDVIVGLVIQLICHQHTPILISSTQSNTGKD